MTGSDPAIGTAGAGSASDQPAAERSLRSEAHQRGLTGCRKVRQPNDVAAEPFAGAVAARAVARLAKVAERALADEGLSLAQYRLLIYLADGTAAAKVLAARLAVSPPSVTSLVESMVERGLVTRGADASDRRRVTHVLTDAGREALARADRAVTMGLEEVASHAPPATARTAERGLQAWLTALDGAVAEKQRAGEAVRT